MIKKTGCVRRLQKKECDSNVQTDAPTDRQTDRQVMERMNE